MEITCRYSPSIRRQANAIIYEGRHPAGEADHATHLVAISGLCEWVSLVGYNVKTSRNMG